MIDDNVLTAGVIAGSVTTIGRDITIIVVPGADESLGGRASLEAEILSLGDVPGCRAPS